MISATLCYSQDSHAFPPMYSNLQDRPARWGCGHWRAACQTDQSWAHQFRRSVKGCQSVPYLKNVKYLLIIGFFHWWLVETWIIHILCINSFTKHVLIARGRKTLQINNLCELVLGGESGEYLYLQSRGRSQFLDKRELPLVKLKALQWVTIVL